MFTVSSKSQRQGWVRPRAELARTSAVSGLAIASILLAACTTTAAGAAKPEPGQYRQATSGVQSESQVSEREALRLEHRASAAASAKVKASGTPADNERESLRQEHLAK